MPRRLSRLRMNDPEESKTRTHEADFMSNAWADVYAESLTTLPAGCQGTREADTLVRSACRRSRSLQNGRFYAHNGCLLFLLCNFDVSSINMDLAPCSFTPGKIQKSLGTCYQGKVLLEPCGVAQRTHAGVPP